MGMREDLIDFIKYMRRTITPWHTSKEIADMLIANDVIPVVRCKDCKYYEIHKPSVLENCERNGYLIPMKPDDFCSYGERRSDV